MRRSSGVLIVAAAGNDGCDCLHVPAALPAVLAVGAMDDEGRPMDFSNWGENYQVEGVLAPGEGIPGAVPGDGIEQRSGTSFATPIVAGVAALLLSREVQAGRKPDAHAVRRAILQSADRCDPEVAKNCSRFLAGKLNIGAARNQMTQESLQSAECDCGGDDKKRCTCPGGAAGGKCTCGASIANPSTNENNSKETAMGENALSAKESDLSANPVSMTRHDLGVQNDHKPSATARAKGAVAAAGAVEPSEAGGLVYVLATLGYDFGSEARRNSFKQLMNVVSVAGTEVPPNPYDARQMVQHLLDHKSEAKALIWTANLELTPIYALRPEGSFAHEIYGQLVDLLNQEILAEDDDKYIERVGLPAYLTGGSVKLFSGQTVPEIGLVNTRGITGWNTNVLMKKLAANVHPIFPPDMNEADKAAATAAFPELLRQAMRSFLDRIYYELRNLGVTSADRALNYAATNAFQSAFSFADALARSYELELDQCGEESLLPRGQRLLGRGAQVLLPGEHPEIA